MSPILARCAQNRAEFPGGVFGTQAAVSGNPLHTDAVILTSGPIRFSECPARTLRRLNANQARPATKNADRLERSLPHRFECGFHRTRNKRLAGLAWVHIACELVR